MTGIRAAIALSALLLLSACGGGGSDAPRNFDITYRVAATVPVQLTYRGAGGGDVQTTVNPGPAGWVTSFQAPEGQFLYLSGQVQERNAAITVTIFANGNTFKTTTSSGDFVIATASGSCC
jgi:hypothetical protein